MPKDETSNQLETRRQTGRAVDRWHDPSTDFWDPSNMFQRFNQQMDRFFGDMGFGRAWRGARQGAASIWAPQIEAFQRGDQFIVRADLPGLKKEDVNIEVTDQVITLKGERREEHEDTREGFYRSERSYGSFFRTVPLPEGAITDSAKANFKDGVLEITVQAPPHEVSRGRRIEITEGRESGKDDIRSSRS